VTDPVQNISFAGKAKLIMAPLGTMREKTSFPAAFSFVKGEIGCLLVHGFGDTAALMEPMASYLNEQNIQTKCMDLPGHGTSLQEFARISSEKLIGTVEREYAKLKESHRSVILVGFSMGGLLALQLGTLRQIEGIVTICAPIFPRGGILGEKALKLIAKAGAAAGINIPKLGITSLSDKSLAACLNGYKKYPARSILCLIELMELTRPILKRVTSPMLVVQSHRDDVVWKDSGRHIYNSVGSKEKRFILLENSRHKAPIDRDRRVLFKEITRFCHAQAAV
jgi:carboxylesterase